MGARLFTDQIEIRIAAEYSSGKSLAFLARLNNCNLVTIRNVVRRQNVSIRTAGGKTGVTDELIPEITSAYRAGESTESLRGKYRCSQAVLCRLLRRGGAEIRHRRCRGKKHGNWKGGRTGTSGGYVLVLVEDGDPMMSMRSRAGYVLEHRLVMARYLGRVLFPWETVHHKDDKRKNNLITNLQLRIGKHGKGIALKCSQCGSINLIPVEL